ncbi:MAG TPA: hypothetical protein VEK10_09510 [Steroidobacteraceae bacterium]|nr:hypothetical protein [Steroidobacteraceae bacterium]
MMRFDGTTFRVGREFKGPMPITPELAGVCCDHRWPRHAVYAIRNEWLEGVWIDRHHNYQAARCADKDLGEWVTIVSVEGKSWWKQLSLPDWVGRVLATLGRWLAVLGLGILGLLFLLLDYGLFG